MKFYIRELLRFAKGSTVNSVPYLLRYRGTIWFLLKTQGIRAALRFIRVKLFVRGEICGIAIWDPLWRLFPRLVPYPFMFELEVTTKCHLRCIMCEHTHWGRDEYGNRDLSFEDFKRIIDQFPRLNWINVTGEGTAILNKDFSKMLRYLKSKGIYVTFVDCFDRLDEKTMREWIELGVDKISISIDGATKETYEAIRVGAKFDRVISNIRRFIELKKELNSPIPELCFRYVFMKNNWREMIQFVELIHSLGDSRWVGEGSMIEFVGLLEFENTKELVYEPPADAMSAVNKRAKELGVWVVWDNPHLDASLKPPMRECVAWTEPYIMIGGYVVSCCAVLMSNQRPFLREHSFGSVLAEDFRDIWYSERYRRFKTMVGREKGEVPILCQGCRAYETTCREKRYGVSGSV